MQLLYCKQCKILLCTLSIFFSEFHFKTFDLTELLKFYDQFFYYTVNQEPSFHSVTSVKWCFSRNTTQNRGMVT